MLREVRFTNYKLLRDVKIELGPLAVFVGRNGSGKSSVLEAVALFFEAFDGSMAADLDSAFRKDASAPEVMSLGSDHLQLEVRGSGEVVGIRIAPFEAAASRWTAWIGEGEQRVHYSYATSGTFTDAVYQQLPLIPTHLYLVPSEIGETQHAEQTPPRMLENGFGLPSVIQYLGALRDGSLEAIEQDLSVIVPRAKRVRALPDQITRVEPVSVTVDGNQAWTERKSQVTGARLEVDFEGVGWVRAEHLSEGTLLALALVTVLHYEKPKLLLLDDIDRGLHPVAQQDLIRLLRRFQERHPDVQILATSHSPFVLDELKPEEAFVVGEVEPGRSDVVRLDKHPDWARHAGMLRPGEFWSAVGERWVGKAT